MAYGYAQRVIHADPDRVIRRIRTLAPGWGMETARQRIAGGLGRERIVPLDGDGRHARAWVWGLAPGLTNVYLGMDDDSLAARVPPGALIVERRLTADANRWLDEVRAGFERHGPARARTAVTRRAA